jgi:hypothetical protein
MRAPRNKIKGYIVFNGDIYHSSEVVQLSNGSYIPKKFALFNPGKNVYIQKDNGYYPNGIMIKDKKIIPVFIDTYKNVYHLKLGYNGSETFKIKSNITKIFKGEEIKNPNSLDNKCIEFINSFPSLKEAREFLHANIISDIISFHNSDIYDDFLLYIEEGEEIPSFLTFKNNIFYLKSYMSLLEREPAVNYWGIYFNKFPYNISEYSPSIKKEIENSFKLVKTPATNNFIRKGARLIGSKYTLGLEIETSSGIFSYNDLTNMKSLPLTDGSLRRSDKINPDYDYTPLEAATLVIKGQAEIIKVMEGYRKSLSNIKFDNKASLHAHFGGYPLENDFIIAFYNLCLKVQNELFKCFPYYKTDPTEVGLNKNYCQKLPDLNLYNPNLYKSNNKGIYNLRLKPLTNNLFKLYSEGYDLSPSYNIGNTIKGTISHPNGTRKWNHNSRYKWNNLMNYFFNPSRTLEIRISPMTDSPEKIMAICLLQYSLIEYASVNRVKLISNKYLKVTLNEVFDIIPDKYVATVMKNYFKLRKEKSYIEDPEGVKENRIICQIEEEVTTLKEKS